MWSLRKIKGYESAFFMPNDDLNNHYLIKAEEALGFAVRMMQRYKISEGLIEECTVKFDGIVKTDLAIRIVHNRATKQDENDKNRFISFDSLMDFLVDSYITQYKSAVVNFTSSLRMSGVSKFDSRKSYENICYAVDPPPHSAR